jgi:hypothetical protein
MHPIKFLSGLALLAALTPASAQIFLFNADFESDTVGSTPSGWVSSGNDPQMIVAADPNDGANNVATWQQFVSNGRSRNHAINLTGYTTGHVLTLGFDLRANSSANTALIVAFAGEYFPSTGGYFLSDAAVQGPLGSVYTFSYTGGGALQHFSFDITPTVQAFATTNPGAVSDFTFGFQPWDNGGAGLNMPSVDNITFVATAVPEPEEYVAVTGAALLGFMVWRRRANR